MIVRTIRLDRRRPPLDFLAEAREADVDLYAKLEDLIERVWLERNPPPRLPRDAVDNLGEGLLELRARGKEKWGRIFYTYGDDHCIVLLDGRFKDQRRLRRSDLMEIRELLDGYRRGEIATVVAWETKPD